MLAINKTIYYFIIFYTLVTVKTQVCVKTKVVTRYVLETFITTRWQYYTKHCDSDICNKIIQEVKHRNVPKTQRIKTYFCCNGYRRTDESTNNSAIQCEPICMPACKNGNCTSPGECTCNSGYLPDFRSKHICLPHCENPCKNGACISPNTCGCNFGHSHINGICQPVCTEPCHNGTCIAPETCQCFPGYRKSEKNLCEPYCSNGCENGICTAPETCTCNNGWNETVSGNHNTKICTPFCSKPCENGNCVAPETCECLPGFKRSDDVCEPACITGWKMDGSECVPVCNYSCGNGNCVSPNVCSCFTGYHIDIQALLSGSMSGPLCIPSCHNCKGICVSPNNCVTENTFMSDDTYFTTKISVSSPSDSSDGTTADSNTYNDNNYYYTDIYNSYDSNETDFDYADIPSPKHSDNNTVYEDSVGQKEEYLWIYLHWELLVVLIAILLVAGIMMVIIWRSKSIIEYFKGRSYVVEEGPPDSYALEDVEIKKPAC